MLTANCEYSPSQYELVYRHAPGMKGADNAFTFKNAVKEIVRQGGLHATFMSKPATDMAGCGAHFHFSLIERKGGRNALIGKGAAHHMSATACHFVQGLMDHGRGAMALPEQAIEPIRIAVRDVALVLSGRDFDVLRRFPLRA